MLDLLRNKVAAMRSAPAPVDELLEEVDTLREQVARMVDERAAVIAAPRPPEEILSALDDALNAAGADALDAFNFPAMLQPGANVGLSLSNSGDARTEVQRLLGLVILLNRSTFKKLLVAQIEQAASFSPVAPLIEGERTSRIAELDSSILAAELAEERAIRRLEQVGITVQRRGDANPLAVLADDAALPG